MTDRREKRRWTVGEYVLGAVLLGFIGYRTIAVGTGAWQAIGVVMVAAAIGLGLAAAIAKGNQISRD